MNQSDIDGMLQQSLIDGKLSRAEKSVLRAILTSDAETAHQCDLLRNRAFEIARLSLLGPDAKKAVDWLEDVTGVLLQIERLSVADSEQSISEVHFSPGNDCRLRIQELLRESRASIDICVFPITDDRITDAVIDAAARGVRTRIIGDNEKAFDPGSDMHRLAEARILIRMDTSPNHMHHKFAVFDGRIAVSGSYNWTRSASEHNQENIMVTNDSKFVQLFRKQFEHLWPQMEPLAW
ncbi:MAG: phospholipase D-like domain-containing protein [Planctomycetaceae bacterium]